MSKQVIIYVIGCAGIGATQTDIISSVHCHNDKTLECEKDQFEQVKEELRIYNQSSILLNDVDCLLEITETEPKPSILIAHFETLMGIKIRPQQWDYGDTEHG